MGGILLPDRTSGVSTGHNGCKSYGNLLKQMFSLFVSGLDKTKATNSKAMTFRGAGRHGHVSNAQHYV